MRRNQIFCVSGFAGISAISKSDFWHNYSVSVLIKIPPIKIPIGSTQSSSRGKSTFSSTEAQAIFVTSGVVLRGPLILILIRGIFINIKMMVTYQKSKFETAETPANPGTQKSPSAAYASKSGCDYVYVPTTQIKTGAAKTRNETGS